jgi:hypothetical protein
LSTTPAAIWRFNYGWDIFDLEGRVLSRADFGRIATSVRRQHSTEELPAEVRSLIDQIERQISEQTDAIVPDTAVKVRSVTPLGVYRERADSIIISMLSQYDLIEGDQGQTAVDPETGESAVFVTAGAVAFVRVSGKLVYMYSQVLYEQPEDLRQARESLVAWVDEVHRLNTEDGDRPALR